MSRIKMRGKIRYFDNLSGQGVVRCDCGACYFLHYSADKTRFPKKRVVFKQNQRVEFTLIHDSHYTQVDSIKRI